MVEKKSVNNPCPLEWEAEVVTTNWELEKKKQDVSKK